MSDFSRSQSLWVVMYYDLLGFMQVRKGLFTLLVVMGFMSFSVYLCFFLVTDNCLRHARDLLELGLIHQEHWFLHVIFVRFLWDLVD